jgi:hypothetical protein
VRTFFIVMIFLEGPLQRICDWFPSPSGLGSKRWPDQVIFCLRVRTEYSM